MPEGDGRRFDDTRLGGEIRELRRLFSARDVKVDARRGLVLRKLGLADDLRGTVVPPPYDQSKLIIKASTGILTKIVDHLVGLTTANQPRVEVNRIKPPKRDITTKADTHARDQELAFNGMLWARDQESPIAEDLMWSAIVEGVGWILSYPYEAAFGLPDRRYWEADDLSDDELDELTRTGTIHRFRLEDPRDGRMKLAERFDSWYERRSEAGRNAMLNGHSLFVTETLPAGVVYYRRDKGSQDLKAAAIIENVPRTEFRAGSDLMMQAALEEFGYDHPDDIARFGLWVNSRREIVGGVEATGQADRGRSTPATDTWSLIRYFTRDECYVAVGAPGADSAKIIWYRPHTWNRVPLDDVYWRRIPGEDPEYEYEPGLEAAYSMVPGFNQALTFASNLMAWNDVPRFVIAMPQGGFAVDEATGQPRILQTEDPAGLNPAEMEIVQNGGKIEQLRIDDGGMTLAMVQFYMAHLQEMLPGRAARGQGDETGPAWTTRLEQEASQLDSKPALGHLRRALNRTVAFWATELRKLDVPVGLLSAPGTRGEAKSRRNLILLDPADISLNMHVTLATNTPQEKLAIEAAGLNYWQAGVIDERRLAEEYFEEEDPDEFVLEMDVVKVLNHLIGAQPAPPDSIIAIVADIVRGTALQRLAEAGIPNAQRLLAATRGGLLPNPAAPGAGDFQGEPALLPPGRENSTLASAGTEAAGIRQAGVGMSPQQPALARGA